MTLIGFLLVAVVAMITTRIHAPQHFALTAIFLTIAIIGASFATRIILIEIIVVWGMYYGLERYFPRKPSDETTDKSKEV